MSDQKGQPPGFPAAHGAGLAGRGSLISPTPFPDPHLLDFRDTLRRFLVSQGYRCDGGGGIGEAHLWAKKGDMPEIFIAMQENGK